MSTKPRNLLFIMSDEHSKRVLGCNGNPLIRTPNLDRLAAGGVHFTDAYCNSPICVPSRTSEMTANPPEVTGVYGNEGSWTSYIYDRALISFPEHFAASMDQLGFDESASDALPEKGPPPPSREAKKQAAKAHAKTYRKARRGERRTRTLGAPRSKPKGGKR